MQARQCFFLCAACKKTFARQKRSTAFPMTNVTQAGVEPATFRKLQRRPRVREETLESLESDALPLCYRAIHIKDTFKSI